MLAMALSGGTHGLQYREWRAGHHMGSSVPGGSYELREVTPRLSVPVFVNVLGAQARCLVRTGV